MRIVLRMLVLSSLLVVTEAQQPFKVGIALDAPPRLSGDCGKATQVHFSGRINATAPGEVVYQWVRSDNASAPQQRLNFTKPGPLPITYTWSIKGSATGWVAFKIISPNPIESRKVDFRINCRY
jgi:hypothetical protein